ncbi:MAG: hypothetical protein ACFFBD_06730, partial [Candidatus Hodarchaeota archaeon]
IARIQRLFSIPVGLAHFSFHLLAEAKRMSVEGVAEIIASSNLFLELNNDRRNYIKEKKFYEACFDLGIPVSLGSDAHSAFKVGEVDHAWEYLKKIDKLNLVINPHIFD